MFFDLLMKAVSDARKASAGNLSIGEMLDKLNKFKDDEQITFTNEKFHDGTFDSYRGYYEDMYIGWSNSDNGANTVGSLKDTLITALNQGEMYGYKGGDFSIDRDTLVWMAEYGNTGDMIVDVQKIDGHIFVVTKEDEWE